MAKMKIKPNRAFFYGDHVLAAGKTVAIEEIDAEFFIKSGWAVAVESKDKGDKADDDKGENADGDFNPNDPAQS